MMKMKKTRKGSNPIPGSGREDSGIGKSTLPRAKFSQIARPGMEIVADIPLPVQSSFGLHSDARTYISIPTNPKPDLLGRVASWRIELHGLGSGVHCVGYDIFDDAVLGRTGDEPDDTLIDLDPFDARNKGVSRRHALLRPTSTALFLLDLGSANGTFCNALRLPPSTVRALTDGDTVTLGNLAFQIRIIEGPHKPQ